MVWRLPTLPAFQASTIGVAGLNGSVRNGKRCTPALWATIVGVGILYWLLVVWSSFLDGLATKWGGQWRALLGKPFGQLVRLGFAIAGFAPAAYRRPRLERPFFCLQNGSLILGQVSRLDAFSAYPLPA